MLEEVPQGGSGGGDIKKAAGSMHQTRVQRSVEQIYGHIRLNNLQYGVLSAYDVTWFINVLDNGKLCILSPMHAITPSGDFPLRLQFLRTTPLQRTGMVQIARGEGNGMGLLGTPGTNNENASLRRIENTTRRGYKRLR